METPVHIMADSGSTVNILTKRDFDCMKPKPHLTDKNAKVYPYMSAKPQVLCGKFRTNIVSDQCSSKETIYVAKGSSGSILSWMTSQKLNLIRAVSTVEQPSTNLPPHTSSRTFLV